MSNNVPDFTEFQLDPFHLTADSGTPAPHRLREARRSFALYLEPAKDTAFQRSLETFQERSFTEFGPNQAHNSAPHVSILSRVHIECSSTTNDNEHNKWDAVDDFVSTVQQQLSSVQLPPPVFCGYEVSRAALTMRFRVDPQYTALAKRIQAKCQSRCSALDVSPMDRVDLAFNVLRPMPKQTLRRLRDMAKETIQIEIGGAWQLTLYEVILESRVVGVRQQVTPVKSWPVRPSPPTKSSSFLPMAFRLKLAVLSSWMRWSSVNPDLLIEQGKEDHISNKPSATAVQ